jgi:hypothetical protein
MVLAAALISACGDDEEGTSVAFDPATGLEPVVQCLTDDGWTEVGSLSSGSAYTLASEGGASVLLSVNEAGTEPLVDETTFTVPGAEAEGGSLNVETITGTLTDDERAQIESCAGG